MTTLDDATIRQFVRDEYPRVLRTVVAACGDRGRAEDAVQDALIKAWERQEDPDSIAAWVTVAAVNRIRSGFRRFAAEGRANERWWRRPTANSLGTEASDLADLLSVLPGRQRQVVALFYLADMSVADVSDALRVSEGTVKTSLSRAREALRRSLDSRRTMEGLGQ